MAKDKLGEWLKKHTFSAEDLIKEQQPFIKLGPRLQELTGGVQFGSGMILSGKPGCGKTTTSLHIAAKAQEQYDSTVWYLNGECRLNPRDFQGCFGFNAEQDKFKIIQPEIGETLYAQEYINAAKRILEDNDNIVVIIDSLSALAPKDLEEGGDPTRRYQSRMPNIMSQFGMVASSQLRKNILIIFIVHEIANISPMSRKSWLQKGGNAIQYMVNYNMRVTHNNDWKTNDGEVVGQINHWSLIKTSSSIKGVEVPSKFRYGIGVDETSEILDIASELAIIKKSGSWYSFGDTKLGQGEFKAIQFLEDNPDVFKEVKERVEEFTD